MLLATPEGEPIWPVFDRRDMQALSQLAILFGGKINRFTRKPVAFDGCSGACQSVAAFGDGLESDARLYAHLTRRSFRVVKSLSELDNQLVPKVLITTPENVDLRLLDALHHLILQGYTTGLIYAQSPRLLRRQVLIRSAAASLVGPLNGRHIAFSPISSVGQFTFERIELLGGRNERTQIKSVLNSGAGLLTITTHSDGIDAYLARDLTLCPIDCSPRRGDRQRSPRCYVTDYCHRQNMSVGQAQASDRLLSPYTISARVLIWNVCTGIIPRGGNLSKVIDGSWGLEPHLLNNCKIGTIITSWQIVLAGPRDIEPLSDAIAAGIPVGKALTDYVKSDVVQRNGSRYIILGDPDVRLPERYTLVN